MYERIYKYAFIHPPRGKYTRGEALLWALVLLVVVTMAMGVLITGMSAGNKYTDILRRQVAEQTIDNYTLAAAMQKIFGGAVTPEDFKLESITYENNATHVLPNSTDTRVASLRGYWWSVPNATGRYSENTYKYKYPLTNNATASMRVNMKQMPWRLYSRIPYTIDSNVAGMYYDSDSSSEALDLPWELTENPVKIHNIEVQSTDKIGAGVPYVIRFRGAEDSTEITVGGDSNTKYNRGAGRWIIQVVPINLLSQESVILNFNSEAITEVEYKSNHAWYITTSGGEYARKTIIVNDGAPIIISPDVMREPHIAPTICSGNSAIIVGDIEEHFPEQ